MQDMINERRAATNQVEHHDIFSGLLDATDLDDEKSKLTDAELIGVFALYSLEIN